MKIRPGKPDPACVLGIIIAAAVLGLGHLPAVSLPETPELPMIIRDIALVPFEAFYIWLATLAVWFGMRNDRHIAVQVAF